MRAIRCGRFLGVLAALSIVVPSTGCQVQEAYKEAKRHQALEDTVRVYIKAVRWGEYEMAAGLIRARDGSLPEIDLASLADVRVVKSDHTLAATSPKDTEAEMFATFQYYRDESTVVRATRQQGTWWYESDTDRWYLDGSLPQFSAR